MKNILLTFAPGLILFLLCSLWVSTKSFGDTTPNAAPLRSVLQPFVDSHSLAGAVVAVADREKVLDLETAGFSDVGAQKSMPHDALFWIASQSKPITATALMMLVDEGKLTLDDPVEKYLPEFHNQWLLTENTADHQLLKQPRHPITVREILSHTSGLPFSSQMEGPTLDLLPLRVAVRSYAMSPLQFQPGSAYQYANAGINTAGRLIEVLSGMPYETFLQKRLFGPLGMKDTTFWPDRAQVLRLAKSYKPNATKSDLEETTVTQLKYPLEVKAGRYPMPAGGLLSTAADLIKFCQMILNNGVYNGRRYLSEDAIKQMTSKQTGSEVTAEYGLGWSTGGGVIGHGGAYSTNMTIDRQHGLIMIFLVQHAGFPGNGDQSSGAFSRAAEALYGTKAH